MSPLLRLIVVALVALASFQEAAAQTFTPGPQYRAFFVDTYNTTLNSAADVAAVVAHAQAANANVLIAQVRRRGDAWYLDTSEPAPEGVSFADGFDPLRDLLSQAHAAGLQVHAWVVLGTVWSQLTVPANPQHVFAQHGFNASGLVAGRANWLTRTLLPDGTLTSAGGYRFGSDFWLDFGHPDAAAYTAAVVAQLVSRYDIDGLHLDRLQYPDPSNTGTSAPPGASVLAGAGASVGYNDTSLSRFRHRYGLPDNAPPPAADDAAWSDWRRAQVSALLRRIYLETMASKQNVDVSAGLVATGNSPAGDDQWNATDAMSHAFQDWRAWLEEGLVDLAVPLNFRAEHQPANADAFTGWLSWTRGHLYQRAALMGLGAYQNAIEGTLRQVRRSLEVTDGSALRGVAIYSMGAHNAPVNNNPFAVPAQRDTPYRTFDDLAAGLKTGKTSSGQALEQRVNAGVFAPGTVPALAPLAWKATPKTGHVKGTVKHADGPAVDTADILIESTEGGSSATTTTDGNGFYGRIGLAPGTYRISVMPVGDGRYMSNCTIDIAAGSVSTLDLMVDVSRPSAAVCTTISSPSRSHLR